MTRLSEQHKRPSTSLRTGKSSMKNFMVVRERRERTESNADAGRVNDASDRQFGGACRPRHTMNERHSEPEEITATASIAKNTELRCDIYV